MREYFFKWKVNKAKNEIITDMIIIYIQSMLMRIEMDEEEILKTFEVVSS